MWILLCAALINLPRRRREHTTVSTLDQTIGKKNAAGFSALSKSSNVLFCVFDSESVAAKAEL
jgi:hypothetical protein